MKHFLPILSLLALASGAPDIGMEMAKQSGARKHGGGRPKQRNRHARYRAWQRVFGGIACPDYVD